MTQVQLKKYGGVADSKSSATSDMAQLLKPSFILLRIRVNLLSTLCPLQQRAGMGHQDRPIPDGEAQTILNTLFKTNSNSLEPKATWKGKGGAYRSKRHYHYTIHLDDLVAVLGDFGSELVFTE
mmetsp:Transcript_36496/g.44161  ORF Transcript_36496/g.44161 Transcript_36496/m.44161 type:complete len:124 (-) Transcript_36496:234-605(-)|eukprot:CAMPEP_0197845998 /NCGR_PEP_ID=MMETSP1438-20131217/2834_1 /TAXON_ID=1461541 /ORGANISM="Pterosperma sp., Strain CCMP1384" /LENGTH=123 /DNA_ID=CAMNT_0043457495 /DNA_START=118 /DNA_END=489 /DNA_ORIENTATION=+